MKNHQLPIIFSLFSLILVLLAIPLTVFLSSQKQEVRKEAAPASATIKARWVDNYRFGNYTGSLSPSPPPMLTVIPKRL